MSSPGVLYRVLHPILSITGSILQRTIPYNSPHRALIRSRFTGMSPPNLPHRGQHGPSLPIKKKFGKQFENVDAVPSANRGGGSPGLYTML